MADTVRLVEYFYVQVPDRAGEGARALATLKDSGVDLLAVSGFPSGRGKAQLDFIPANPAAFRGAARQAKWKLVGPKRGFLVQGDNRVGVIADLMAKLGGAKINVTAIDAVAANGSYGAILWVAPRDVKKAATVLGAQ